MVGTKDITIGAFLGLITKEGRVRYYRRKEEEGWQTVPGISFRGDFYLPGGYVQRKGRKLRHILSQRVLFTEAASGTEEDLGISITIPAQIHLHLYRAVSVNYQNGTENWDFIIPIPSIYWDEDVPTIKQIVDVNPDELYRLANYPKGEQIAGGWGEQMSKMGLAALFACSYDRVYRKRSEDLLIDIESDWLKEFSFDGENMLAEIRKDL